MEVVFQASNDIEYITCKAPPRSGWAWVLLDDFRLHTDTNASGVAHYSITKPKKLLRIIDVLGRERKRQQPDVPLFYIYDDGTVEKRLIIE